MLHTGCMADDDIERILREVNALNSGAPQTPARSSSQVPVPKKESGAGGRVAFAVGSGVVLGMAGWVTGLLMPFVGSFSAGVGAALGAFVTALVAGPPRWFSS
jgi:hypothetical protein